MAQEQSYKQSFCGEDPESSLEGVDREDRLLQSRVPQLHVEDQLQLCDRLQVRLKTDSGTATNSYGLGSLDGDGVRHRVNESSLVKWSR